MIQQVVAAGDAAEHAAHPARGFLLRRSRRAEWFRSCERRLDRFEHHALVDPGNDSHLADAHRQHEMHFALHGFLIGSKPRGQRFRA